MSNNLLSGLEFKAKYGTVFYKVLRSDLMHHGFKYQLGLNVDTNPFNPSGSCQNGGLYFTNIKHLFEFLDYGQQIAFVEIPDNSQIYIEKDKFKANQIIIKRILSDTEFLELLKTNLVKLQSDICVYVAKSGHLETLKWARAHGFSWNERTCAYAAANGHLETLKWARDHGCPWDERTCAHAAANGHLETLKWAREHGCPWDERTCTCAALNGHLETLKWARDDGCPCGGKYHP